LGGTLGFYDTIHVTEYNKIIYAFVVFTQKVVNNI